MHYIARSIDYLRKLSHIDFISIKIYNGPAKLAISY